MGDERQVTRRCALGALALGLSAPVLVACGAGDGTPATGDAPSFAPPDTGRATPSEEPTETTEAETTTEPGAAALVAVAAVPVGGGVILDDQRMIVTQPTEGEIHAFSAVCPHAQVILSDVSASDIYCGNGHGSRFSLNEGAVLVGPATTPLTRIPVTVEAGQVVRT